MVGVVTLGFMRWFLIARGLILSVVLDLEYFQQNQTDLGE